MSNIALGRSTAELVQLAQAGASFWMKPIGRTTEELSQIVRAAAQGGGTVTILGTVGRTTADLLKVTQAGAGHVVFAPAASFFKEND